VHRVSRSVAKASTSGYIPTGAFIVSEAILDALKDTPTEARFMHAYTNSAHPTAAAVALRNLQIMEDEQLLQNATAMGDRLGEGLRDALGGHGCVTDLRHLGLMAGFSLVEDASTGAPFEALRGMGVQVQKHMREQGGVITRIVGDNVLFAPPLIV